MLVTTKEIKNDVYLYYKNKGKKNIKKLKSNTEYSIPVDKAYIKIFANNYNTRGKKAKRIIKGIILGVILLALEWFGYVGAYEDFLVRRFVIENKKNVVLEFTPNGKLADESVAKEKPCAIFIEVFSALCSLVLLLAIVFAVIMIIESNKK